MGPSWATAARSLRGIGISVQADRREGGEAQPIPPISGRAGRACPGRKPSRWYSVSQFAPLATHDARFCEERAMYLSNESLFIIVIVGVIAGWLAGKIVDGGGFGFIGDLAVGIIGAFIGDWLLPRLGIHLGFGLIALIANATIGAIVLLVIIRGVAGNRGWGYGWGNGWRWRGRWGGRW